MTLHMVVGGNHAMNEESVCNTDRMTVCLPDRRTDRRLKMTSNHTQTTERIIAAGSAASHSVSDISGNWTLRAYSGRHDSVEEEEGILFCITDKHNKTQSIINQ